MEVSLVRQLLGTLQFRNATSAVVVTTSCFSRGAGALQRRHEYGLALRDNGHVVNWIAGSKSCRADLN
jgi:restriction system protein